MENHFREYNSISIVENLKKNIRLRIKHGIIKHGTETLSVGMRSNLGGDGRGTVKYPKYRGMGLLKKRVSKSDGSGSGQLMGISVSPYPEVRFSILDPNNSYFFVEK